MTAGRALAVALALAVVLLVVLAQVDTAVSLDPFGCLEAGGIWSRGVCVTRS